MVILRIWSDTIYDGAYCPNYWNWQILISNTVIARPLKLFLLMTFPSVDENFRKLTWLTRFPFLCTFFMAPQPLVGQGLFHFRGFTITLRHTTLGSTPLDEQSSRHTNFCLTTHTNHKWTFFYKSLQTYSFFNGTGLDKVCCYLEAFILKYL